MLDAVEDDGVAGLPFFPHDEAGVDMFLPEPPQDEIGIVVLPEAAEIGRVQPKPGERDSDIRAPASGGEIQFMDEDLPADRIREELFRLPSLRRADAHQLGELRLGEDVHGRAADADDIEHTASSRIGLFKASSERRQEMFI